MVQLKIPSTTQSEIERFIETYLSHLTDTPIISSPSIRGGQTAANSLIKSLDLTGYAANRNEVLPLPARGATGLSPYIRHGILQLKEVWRQAEGAPAKDKKKFQDELLWQEYARHWYAALGEKTKAPTRRKHLQIRNGNSWDRTLPCIDMAVEELETHGWLVNQTRMWLSSDWSVRNHQDWRKGEDRFFQHLIDGSRAANRLGWQWTTGIGSSKSYGFSRWQVEKRAPGLCNQCSYQKKCPIQEWPDEPLSEAVLTPTRIDNYGTQTPLEVDTPRNVWLTAESLGLNDPALYHNPNLPAVFVFDEPLLKRLKITSKRFVFILETLAEISETRPLRLYLGNPQVELAGIPLAVTHAPVPGFQKHAKGLNIVQTWPWPWLCKPNSAPIHSFSSWVKKAKLP
tara:strand:+ start:32 stop:1228 length:1197 start_codon:yes stop_codon:yes gene_type:complete